MESNSINEESISLTSKDMQRFHRNASAALRSREGTFAFDEFAAGLRSVIMGLIPIIGMMRFEWSAEQLLLFLYAGTWTAILCDFAKLRYLEPAIRKWADASYDDWHVWVVVESLRSGKKKAPKSHLRAKYKPSSGVIVDIVFGGLSTLMIFIGLMRSPDGFDWNQIAGSGVVLSLSALIGYQVLLTIWEIVEHRFDWAEDRQVKIAMGLRGVGLFLFLFLFVFVTEGFENTSFALKIVMLIVNGSIVFYGLLTMIGPWIMRKETAWLGEYLANQQK